jgi:hypothetical protein
MRTMLLAAATVLPLTAGIAYAGDGEGTAANTQFTTLPGVVAQADVPNAPTYAQNRQTTQAQNGQGVHVYVSRSNQGTWLFAPNPNAGSNS